MQDGLNRVFFLYSSKKHCENKISCIFSQSLIKQTLKTLSNSGNIFCGIPALYKYTVSSVFDLSTSFNTIKVFSAHCKALAIISDCNRHQIFHIFCNCNHKQSILFRAVGTWGPIAPPPPPQPILAEIQEKIMYTSFSIQEKCREEQISCLNRKSSLN